MGSSRTFSCATAVLILCLSSAAEVRDQSNMEQREVTFDIDHLMQEMQGPDSFMSQKEVDLSDLLQAEDFGFEQTIVSPKKPKHPQRAAAPPRGRFGPRSFPPAEKYPVFQFPLARPTPQNIGAICGHLDHRPNYPDSYFPDSGYGQLRRQATAVNSAESWFRTCCRDNPTQGEEVTLCCATQAWMLSVDSFCEDNSRVKDRQYECCRLSSAERMECFNRNALNTTYQPTLELPVVPVPAGAPFTFDPDSCQRTLTAQFSIRGHREEKKKIDISFPPGRPTVDSIQSLCDNQKLRPRYSVKCLPNTGFEYLARQAKTVNRVEKGFKQCCKKQQGSLTCAEKKWRDELNRFCSNKNGAKVDFQCCSSGEAVDRHQCFQSISPDPFYNVTASNKEVSLSGMCGSKKIVKMFSIKSFVNKCCPLSAEDQNNCISQMLKEDPSVICSSKKALPPSVRRCCRLATEESQQCITKNLLDAISKATGVMRQKKKKICPIS